MQRKSKIKNKTSLELKVKVTYLILIPVYTQQIFEMTDAQDQQISQNDLKQSHENVMQ